MDINLNNNMKKFLLIWLMMVLMVVAGCKDERVVQFAQSEVQIVTSDGTIISVYDSYGDFSNCICRADDGTVVGAFLNNENGRVDILGYSPGETNVRIIDETTGGTLSMCRVRVLGPDDVDFEISDEQLSFQNTSQSIFVLKAQSKYNLMATSTNYTPSSLFYLSVESDNDEVAQVKLIECFPPNPDGQTNWHTKHNEFTHKFEYSYCEIPIELVGAGEACITISFANGSNNSSLKNYS